MKRKVECQNGNTVERFYDRQSRSSVVIVKDPEQIQIGEADYEGNPVSLKFVFNRRIAENGGEK